MKKIKLSREYGGWVTLTLTFVLFLFYSYINKDYKGLIFWVPAFLGISIFDRNFFEFDKITIFSINNNVIFSNLNFSLLFCINSIYFIPYLIYSQAKKNKHIPCNTFWSLRGNITSIFFPQIFGP